MVILFRSSKSIIVSLFYAYRIGVFFLANQCVKLRERQKGDNENFGVRSNRFEKFCFASGKWPSLTCRGLCCLCRIGLKLAEGVLRGPPSWPTPSDVR